MALLCLKWDEKRRDNLTLSTASPEPRRGPADHISKPQAVSGVLLETSEDRGKWLRLVLQPSLWAQ